MPQENATIDPFTQPFTIAGVTYNPLSAPVTTFARHRGNVLLKDGSKRDQSEIEATGEILFIASLSKEDRVKHFRTPLVEWDELVAEFTVGLDDHAIPELAALVSAARERAARESQEHAIEA